ncbi:MAG: glycosyltransferase [Patescibacteria group bacterium]
MEREINLSKKFIVGFWGKFIPLQGVPYIIEAAKILEFDSDINFELIGDGQTYQESISLAKKLGLTNICFAGQVPFIEMPLRIKKYDLCLGIFGETEKTLRVIPNKIYEAIACVKPVITANTPAIKELFYDQNNILLCQRANAKDLAEKIILLKNNHDLRKTIASGGYKLYHQFCRPVVIAEKLIKDLF